MTNSTHSFPKGVIQVLADDREKNDRLLHALKNMGNAVVYTGRLMAGDYLAGNLLVERKRIADFCISLIDGRLFSQAKKLASSKCQPLIILEGTAADIKASGIKRQAIQGALITLSLIFRIPILRSISPEESAELILYAAGQIKKAGLSSRGYYRPFSGKKSFSKKRRIQMHVLQGFPGIGPVLAEQLLNKFGKLSAIFNASEHDLAEVPGLGKERIKRICEILN